MANDNYQSETKCRRCGWFTVWHFSARDMTRRLDFEKWVVLKIVEPVEGHCAQCGFVTVQDYSRFIRPD